MIINHWEIINGLLSYLTSLFMRTTGFTSRKAFTLLTAGFILHNIEEAITMPGQQSVSQVSFLQLPTYNQFLLSVAILTIAALYAYIAAMRTKNDKTYLFISTAIAAALLFNVFVPHLAAAALTLKYTPGLITAVLLNLPFGILLLKLNKPLFADRRQMIIYILGGFGAGYLLFAAVMGTIRLFI
jgi:uncharacterized membrane protein YidH (DUF202 family)